MLAREMSALVAHDHGSSEHDHGNAKVNLIVAVVGGILIVNSALADWLPYYGDEFQSKLSAIIGAIILALPILVSAVKDVLRGRIYMNELVALALIAAFVMGYYQEAGRRCRSHRRGAAADTRHRPPDRQRRRAESCGHRAAGGRYRARPSGRELSGGR